MIRWMIRRDLQEVLDIERHSFEFPWSKQDFLDATRRQNVVGMVVDNNDTIDGYCLYALSKKMLTILNIAARPSVCRQGIGSSIVSKLKSKLSGQRNIIEVEVRETNLAAQLFFRENGFVATRVLSDWYDETDEDAYLFEFTLGMYVPENRIKRFCY